MKDKLIGFTLFIILAAICFFPTKNEKTITCSNEKERCYLTAKNTILNTSKVERRIKFTKRNGYYDRTKFSATSNIDDVETKFYYKKNYYNYMACYKHNYTKKTNKGSENKSKYLLTTSVYAKLGAVNSLNTLNEYSSLAACELDRQVIEKYLNSNKTSELNHQVASTHLNFLWYLGTGFFALLAILILFSKNVSEAELKNIPNMSDEQKQAVYDKITGLTNFVSKFDSDAANKIDDIAEKFKKFNIDTDKKDK